MAQKTYTKHTLNGNWFEERAAPLKGVIADYGFRETGTTAADSLRPPAKSREYKRQLTKRAFRRGMVTEDSLAEAKISWAGGEDSGPGFGALIATHGAQHDARMFESTAAAAFGRPPKPTIFEERQLARTKREAVATITRREERKEAALHATGEVLKSGADPQENTAAQRAWLYGQDAGLRVMAQGRPQEVDRGYMSLNIAGNSIPVAKGRKADITLNNYESSLRPGVNVWGDEIQ